MYLLALKLTLTNVSESPSCVFFCTLHAYVSHVCMCVCVNAGHSLRTLWTTTQSATLASTFAWTCPVSQHCVKGFLGVCDSVATIHNFGIHARACVRTHIHTRTHLEP